VIVLVALRLGVGWHFFKEGVDKLNAPNFSSTGFLSNAKGPFAGMYKGIIPDPDGVARLDEEQTRQTWLAYRDQVVSHYGFDDKQTNKADEVYKMQCLVLGNFFKVNQEGIDDYLEFRLPRKNKNDTDPNVQEVATLKGQAASIEGDLRGDRAPWLKTIDSMWDAYERDLIKIASEEQLKAEPLALKRPGDVFFDTDLVDFVIPWFDTIIGGLLLLGLFTRLSSIAGALFLGSVVVSQWPLSPDSVSTYFQFNLMLAMLLLAALGAGRYAGLDFFISRLLISPLKKWCCPTKQEES